MAVAQAVFTQSPYPKGQDMTQRRLILHGPIAVSASPATYPSGGIPLTSAASTYGNTLSLPGVSKPSPVTVNFASRAGKGYVYSWVATDLWTAKYKGNSVTAGQALTDSNGNLQICTTGGTAGSGSEPTWNQTNGLTTTDNTVVWTNNGPSFGTLQILEQNGSTGPLIELTQGATIPSDVSGDTIAAQIEFLKG